ncbi:MAG: sulfotransferase domain-containing protein [Chitinophagales bacterium]|nr:sulfotransferase domain-containing protein [Hyphomicrobiales bacterium]
MTKPHKTTLGKAYFLARSATAPLRALPDFLIIGAQKSATSSLFHYLMQNPQMREPMRKEIHYFADKHKRGLNWYRAHFPLVRSMGDAVTGEGSTSYLFLPGVAERVKAYIPDIKLIAILRNPIDRALSQYQHNKHQGRAPYSFHDYIMQEAAHDWTAERNLTKMRQLQPMARGFYAEQIERWLAHFDRSQFLFIKYENFVASPQSEIDRACDFLDVSRHIADTSKRYKSRGVREVIEDKTRTFMKERFDAANMRLPSLIGDEFKW